MMMLNIPSTSRRLALLAAVLMVCAACAPALAQDAVGGVLGSNCGGTSGLDCKAAGTEDAYDSVVQRAFVIDMGQQVSSWGNWYGYAPIKASRSIDPLFMSNLISAQTTSMRIATVQTPASPLYGLWHGQGFGPANPQSTIAPPAGDLYRVGAAFADFGSPAFPANNIVSATIEVSTENYNRLYVTRHESLTDRPNAASGSNAAFGIGGVDTDGNPSLRADNSAAVGAQPLVGNNWISVDNSARSPVVNYVFNAGAGNMANDAAATSYIANNYMSGGLPTVLTPPTVIDAAGMASPLTAGGSFNGEYVFSDGTPSGVLVTTGHLAAGLTTGQQRGNMAFTHTYTALGNGVNDAGTGAMLNKFGAGTDSFAVFGVNTDGSVDGVVRLTLPAAITDPTDGFDPTAAGLGAGTGQFDHYHSQVAFNGGNGQIALAGDRTNPDVLYAAAVVYYSAAGNTDPWNYIAVAKFDHSTATTTWTVGAYNAPSGVLPGCTGDCADPGKAVLDGPGGNVIGRILPLFTVTNCGTLGPSISAPMLDTDGNIYFMAAWERFLDTDTNGVCDATDTDSGLFKGHRNPATGGYELELILSLGNTIYGPNSDTRYSWRFMGVADNNSVSSGTVWSGNIVQDRLPGALVNSLDTFDSGGFIVNVSTTYDVDKDGDYARPTGATPDDPISSDEAYDMAIYVRGYVRTGACCLGVECAEMSETDCATAEGTFNGTGSVCEFTSCAVACAPTDVNCDGNTDGGDILVVRSSANWLQPTGSAGNPRADVNVSGTVDGGDILVIRSSANWLTSTGPCACP